MNKAGFVSTAPPDPPDASVEEHIVTARQRVLAERQSLAARPSRHTGSPDEAWLRSRADWVLTAASVLIVLWVLVPALHVSAVVIVALLALAGTAFKAIASMGVASALRKMRR